MKTNKYGMKEWMNLLLTHTPALPLSNDWDAPLSEDQFQHLLLQERERANRYGQFFSVVELDLEAGRSKREAFKHLKGYLQHRLRCSDQWGWIDEDHVAVLLIHSRSENARRFADDLNAFFREKGLHFPYRVYFYPTRPTRDHRQPKDATGTPEEAPSPAEALPPDAEPAPGAHLLLGYRLPLWKRVLDILIASLALALAAPVMILIALFIKIVSPGPAFFTQERVGHQGRPFVLWKFRTMKPRADCTAHKEYLAALIRGGDGCGEDGKPMVKMDEDPQIIPCGNILRKSCLDELPQLFNVLKGDMSIVGPRPAIPYEADEYLGWHNGRLDTVPGMTGLWQVSGKNRLTFNQMVRLDIQYLRGKSFLMDLKIILRTPLAILQQVIPSHKFKKQD